MAGMGNAQNPISGADPFRFRGRENYLSAGSGEEQDSKFAKVAFIVILTAIMPPAGILLAVVWWIKSKNKKEQATVIDTQSASPNNASCFIKTR
jgi:hypothetical protein